MRIFSYFGENDLNQCGNSGKIYKIERRGRTVHAWWGPAGWEDMRPFPVGTLQHKQWTKRSPYAAEEFRLYKIAEKEREGYRSTGKRRPSRAARD
jgi:hypothetical protein